MKILIVGGDSEALAINHVLSGIPGFDTTVATEYQNPDLAPYPKGARRQHGRSQALESMLEYFKLNFAQYQTRNAAIIDGEIADLCDCASIIDTEAYYLRTRGTLDGYANRQRSGVQGLRAAGFDSAFADTEQLVSSKGLSFDAGELHQLLHEEASPIPLDSVDWGNGYDHTILASPRWR